MRAQCRRDQGAARGDRARDRGAANVGEFAYVREDWESKPGLRVHVKAFLVDVVAGWEPTLNEEHDEYRWLRRDEAAALLFGPSPRSSCERCRGEAPPQYTGEGPHALWHVSEDDSIRRFEPRDGKVWAIATRLLPLYWFPRDCPRTTFWAGARDHRTRRRPFPRRRPRPASPRRRARLARADAKPGYPVAYRMPEETFVENDDRFWISTEPVEPLELVELGDLVARHEAAGIELRTEDDLLGFWDQVIGSSLGYSGIRLRNAVSAGNQ